MKHSGLLATIRTVIVAAVAIGGSVVAGSGTAYAGDRAAGTTAGASPMTKMVRANGTPAASTVQAKALTTSFTSPDGNVWGTVTWTSSHSYSVSTKVYGFAAGPGYYTQGHYYQGNENITCTWTPTDRNYTDGIIRTYNRSSNCSRANIQTVLVGYVLGGYDWLSNPLA